MEVVISPRRNKFGNCFGFTRFKEVGDDRVLAVKLDNIFIDKKKIHANPPCFALKGAREAGMDGSFKQGFGFLARNEVNGGSRNQRREGGSLADGIISVFGTKSFADMVVGVKDDIVVKKGNVDLSFNFVPEVRERWQKDYIGVVLNPGESYNLQTHFEIEGVFTIKNSLWGKICACWRSKRKA